MSKHKNRLNKLEKRARPDTYRKRYFIPWERRAPLTAEEWVFVNDVHETAHRRFETHLKRGEGRLLSQKELDRLNREYEETGDFEALWAVIGAPNVYVDDCFAWDFLTEEDGLERACVLLDRHLRHNMLNDPEWCHMVTPRPDGS